MSIIKASGLMLFGKGMSCCENHRDNVNAHIAWPKCKASSCYVICPYFKQPVIVMYEHVSCGGHAVA